LLISPIYDGRMSGLPLQARRATNLATILLTITADYEYCVRSGERHRTFVRRMEVELAGDPELEKDINPYNLPEVSKAINSDSEMFIGGSGSLFFYYLVVSENPAPDPTDEQ
jgi:hypothetical protein